MSLRETNEERRIESELEIKTYLDRMKYALQSGKAKIVFQKKRNSDANRNEQYTNRFTMHYLFPDEDEVAILKRELGVLKHHDYIETVKDRDCKAKSELRIFGKKYSEKDVYIKIRVELINDIATIGDNFIFVMSFHFAEYPFVKSDFPYRKMEGI